MDVTPSVIRSLMRALIALLLFTVAAPAAFAEENPFSSGSKFMYGKIGQILIAAAKAELVAALQDAVAYCNKSYDSLTDASAAQHVKFMGMELTKLAVYSANTAHAMEHYGNLVTYMRIRNVVPPTSDPEFSKQLSK